MQKIETGKVELTLSRDPRLLAGVAGAVNHFAETAGMDESARANLVAAIEDACNEAFVQLPKANASIEMSLESPPGAVETVLIFHGAAAQSERVEKIQRAVGGRLDRVARESESGTIRLTLIKNAAAPRRKR